MASTISCLAILQGSEMHNAARQAEQLTLKMPPSRVRVSQSGQLLEDDSGIFSNLLGDRMTETLGVQQIG